MIQLYLLIDVNYFKILKILIRFGTYISGSFMIF